MHTLLVPVDGSALAEQVLPYVRVLAPLLHADVRLLGVVSDASWCGCRKEQASLCRLRCGSSVLRISSVHERGTILVCRPNSCAPPA